MTLMANCNDYHQLHDCVYICKCFEVLKCRLPKEELDQILSSRIEHEILILERVQSPQERLGLLRYNNKRCKCKIKTTTRVNSNNGCSKRRSNKSTNHNNNCTIQYGCLEICTSLMGGVWQRGPYVSSEIITTDTFYQPREQWPALCPSLTVPLTESWRFTMMETDMIHTTATERKSKFCDISSNYLKEKYVNSQITLLTYKKEQLIIQKHKQTFHNQSCLLMMLSMVVRGVIHHIKGNLNRMRRKVQYLLPVLILLQLLMAAPLSYCTSPPNQTIAAVVSSASEFLSSVALMKDFMNTPVKDSIPSSANITMPKTSTISSSENKILGPRIHQQQLMSTDTVALNMPLPSTGSSFTSHINLHTIRREPGISFTASGCHSCKMREQVKADNLESIKRHILLRLEMTSIPNMTIPSVPHVIIENFYKNNSYFEKKTPSFNDATSNPGKSNLVYTTLSLSQSESYVHGGDRTKKTEHTMQGDDPNIYTGSFDEDSLPPPLDDRRVEHVYINHYEEEFYSSVNSVYVFPIMPRMRHNRKTEILNFVFKNNEHTTISRALLRVYIRGREWISEYEPGLLETKNSISDDRRQIVITVTRVIRRINSTIATHTLNVTESQHKIPNGIGQWVSIDITTLVQGWLRNTTTNQGIIIKGSESWMKPFIVTGDSPNNKAFSVYIEMLTKDNRKRRTKRSTSMNCSESDNEERCCRYPLAVNFVDFGWTWVIAPTSFNAYFCNGECKLGFLEKYPHTHLMQLSTAPQPCCSPTKMSPLRLLYFNTENTLVMSTIPNMAVEKCSCS